MPLYSCAVCGGRCSSAEFVYERGVHLHASCVGVHSDDQLGDESRAERSEMLMVLDSTACPKCEAKPGEPCVPRQVPTYKIHTVRREAFWKPIEEVE